MWREVVVLRRGWSRSDARGALFAARWGRSWWIWREVVALRPGWSRSDARGALFAARATGFCGPHRLRRHVPDALSAHIHVRTCPPNPVAHSAARTLALCRRVGWAVVGGPTVFFLVIGDARAARRPLLLDFRLGPPSGLGGACRARVIGRGTCPQPRSADCGSGRTAVQSAMALATGCCPLSGETCGLALSRSEVRSHIR